MNSYYDYYKLVLDKVSFDGALLVKEYQKAKKLLDREEMEALDNWLFQAKGKAIKEIINQNISIKNSDKPIIFESAEHLWPHSKTKTLSQ